MNKRAKNRAGRLVCGLLACALIAAGLPAAVWADEALPAAEQPAASQPAAPEQAGPESAPAPQPAETEGAPAAESQPAAQQNTPEAQPQPAPEDGPAVPQNTSAPAEQTPPQSTGLPAEQAPQAGDAAQNEEQTGDARQQVSQTASYTVVYWAEGLGEDAIFLCRTVNEQAAVGGTVQYQAGLTGLLLPQGIDPNGFILDAALTGKAPTVEADGHTVMNVYFARNTFAITFMDEHGQKELGRISAKYGEDISKQWKQWCEHSNWGQKMDEVYPQYTMFSNMPAKDITVYQKPKTEQGEKQIVYYIEDLKGNDWSVYAAFPVPDGVGLSEEDQQPITGFTYHHQIDSSLCLYYTRNSYTLSLVNGEKREEIPLKFEAPVADILPEPEKPEGVDADSEFAGWYLSEKDGSQPFSDKGGMPAHDLILYARWQPPVTVTYVTGREDEPGPATAHRGDLLRQFLPSEMGPGFLGWYIDQALTKQALPNQVLTQNLTLYAKWESGPVGPTDPPKPTDPPEPTTPSDTTPATPGSGGTNGTGTSGNGGIGRSGDADVTAAVALRTPQPLAARPAPAAEPEEAAELPLARPQAPAAALADAETPQAGPARMRITIENPDGGSGGVELGEERTPMAGPGGHKNCVLHFLILLAALVAELIFTSEMKKAQQRVFNARLELAEYEARHPKQ